MIENFQTRFSVLVFVFLCTCFIDANAAEQPRQELNSDWTFYRFDSGEVFDPSQVPTQGWLSIQLPHTARLEPRVVNDQWQGDALYRRSLVAEAAWESSSVWLRFEGAMMVADVYLNGHLVHHHKGGYLPFTVDLSGKLKYGQANEILVHLDNRDNAITGPKPLEILDFNTYGGIYREVGLLVRDRLHISDEILEKKVAGGGIFVTYPEVSKTKARVAVKTHIRNTDDRVRKFQVSQELMAGGRVLAKTISVPLVLESGAALEDQSDLEILNPGLWSPESPELHRLVTQIVSGEEVIDQRFTSVGIRRISLEGGEFHINGKKRFLRGVNRHQEYPYIGYAVSPEADYRDAKLIKEAGFDYVRLSHYPHSRHFMDAADELGLVLVDAILGWQYYNPDPAFSDHVEQTCRDLIRRDRNHPSVIAWECSLNESGMPPEFVARLHRTVHEEYPGDQAWSAGWMSGYDIYLQARQHRLEHYEQPSQPYIVSEYGDWEYYALNAGLDQDNWGDLREEERSSRQWLGSGEQRLLQQATNIQEAHNDNFTTPAFADGYWVMFDYNRGYADDHETSGIMSIDRVPKFSYYFFQSQRSAQESSPRFTSGPMVKIASYWNAQSSPEVRVFSNAEEVELRLNGESRGRQKPDQNRISKHLAHPPFTFRLPKFVAGKLEAIAYIGGKPVAQDRVSTPGDAIGIELELKDQGVSPVSGDLVFLQALLVDGNGERVPENGVKVTFLTDCGPDAIRLLGPGTVATEAGIASTLVQLPILNPLCQVKASVEGRSWIASLSLVDGQVE